MFRSFVCFYDIFYVVLAHLNCILINILGLMFHFVIIKMKNEKNSNKEYRT